MTQMWLKMLEKYALVQWRTRYPIRDADLWESSNMRKKCTEKGFTNSSFMSKRN